ncbi:hypothetical protein SXCC_02536 [Gluconacetobacter sp. SXCC-1]|nr:hypothetical protein SXCC_02536 [Gluconacetobacter sp. SXCC-1]
MTLCTKVILAPGHAGRQAILPRHGRAAGREKGRWQAAFRA